MSYSASILLFLVLFYTLVLHCLMFGVPDLELPSPDSHFKLSQLFSSLFSVLFTFLLLSLYHNEYVQCHKVYYTSQTQLIAFVNTLLKKEGTVSPGTMVWFRLTMFGLSFIAIFVYVVAMTTAHI